MPYCVVFGCNSNSKNEKNLHWFRFPQDQGRLKTWIHYCRRQNFVPSKHSRVCGKHFSPAQFSRDPSKLAEYGYTGARIALKDDAFPDIPMDYSESSAPKKPRTAYEKRRKGEVLEAAMSSHEQETTESQNELDSIELVEQSSQRTDTGINTEQPETKSIKSQTDPPPNKTRRIQVRPTTTEIGIQCDLILPLQPLPPSLFVSIPVAHESDDDEDENCNEPESEVSSIHCNDDSDYEPDESFVETDEDEESGEDETTNYRLQITENPEEEKYYLVSESSLCQLLSKCRVCGARSTSIIEYSKGTMISTCSVCPNDHTWKWNSQTMHNRLPWGNLLLSSAIILSGNSTAKTLRLLNHMKVQAPSSRSVSRLQAAYTIPSVLEEFDNKQYDLLNTLTGDRVEVVLGGDGRCDSPGYSAKYGSYTLMDLETSKILDVQLVQSNEVAGSTHMELEGLKRGLDYVIAQKHLNVSALVTDRHVMIKKYMRENHRNIKHYFDVWHIAKGISKKLEACAKKKTCEDIRPWIRSINNHAYWVAASSGDDREMKLAKWVSITNHVMNRHHHESPLFPRCLHEDIEYRDWLIEGSRSFKLVKGVVESQYLLRDLPQMSPVHQTYGLEVFHSVVNEFAPKSTHFFKNAMQARVYIAALHFNENGKRQQATKRDGTAQWSKSYPKAKKGNACVVKAKRTPPTFAYIEDLMHRIFARRQQYDTVSAAYEDYSIGYPQPQPLTSSFVQFDKDDLIQNRASRFNVTI